jgi:hypothetical protein
MKSVDSSPQQVDFIWHCSAPPAGIHAGIIVGRINLIGTALPQI